TRTGINPVKTAKASSTNNFSTARQKVNKQTVLTSTDLKVYTVKVKVVSIGGGKGDTVVKSSAGCKWRTPGYNKNILSKYNGGSSLRNYSTFKDPLGRLKPQQAWVPKRV
ncbi:hypothetical protein Tco_0258111, partial [Tanacetum coccineum]